MTTLGWILVCVVAAIICAIGGFKRTVRESAPGVSKLARGLFFLALLGLVVVIIDGIVG